MPQFTKILDCLFVDPRGVIIACNVIDGLRLRRYDAAFVKKVLRQWKRYHNARARAERLGARTWTFEEFWKSLEQYRGTRPKPIWWTGPNYSDVEMKCKASLRPRRGSRYGASRPTEEIVEAMSSGSHSTFRGHFIFWDSSGSFVNNDVELNLIRAAPESSRRFTLDVSAKIPKHGRLLWFTQASGLTAAASAANPANAVRDRLGLVHYEPDFSATAVFFGSAELGLVKSARPTFGDAASHRRFMMRAGRAKNRKRSAWGYTADLSKIAPAAPDFDGSNERVSSAFEGSTIGPAVLTMLPLGKTSGKRGASPDDDDHVFADLLSRRVSRRLLSKAAGLANLRRAFQKRGIY